MLEVKEVLHRDTTSRLLVPRQPRRRIRVSGQSLSKTKHQPHELGNLAARWVLGALVIDPPIIALATKIFSVSPALVRQAVNNIEATTVAQPDIDMTWSEMDDGARGNFIRSHLAEVWRLVDQITA
jgi:hypothetical protein